MKKSSSASKKSAGAAKKSSSAAKRSVEAVKKSASKRQSNDEFRFFSLAEVSKHFKMPEVEIGVHVNARHSQSISDALRGAIAATVARKSESGQRKAKSHAE